MSFQHMFDALCTIKIKLQSLLYLGCHCYKIKFFSHKIISLCWLPVMMLKKKSHNLREIRDKIPDMNDLIPLYAWCDNFVSIWAKSCPN